MIIFNKEKTESKKFKEKEGVFPIKQHLLSLTQKTIACSELIDWNKNPFYFIKQKKHHQLHQL